MTPPAPSRSVRARALGLAGLALLLASVGAAAPAACGLVEDCEGRIRPGASTGACTLNFVLTDDAGHLHVGTAGHCEPGRGATGARLVVEGLGDVATVVWDGWGVGLPGEVDAAFARVDDAFAPLVSATLCRWGGPVGLAAPEPGQPLVGYGWGDVYRTTAATRARAGAVLAVEATTFTYFGFAQPGDSGAPLVDAHGRALGFHVASPFGVAEVARAEGLKTATRLDAALAAAAEDGVRLHLLPGGDFNLFVGSEH